MHIYLQCSFVTQKRQIYEKTETKIKLFNLFGKRMFGIVIIFFAIFCIRIGIEDHNQTIHKYHKITCTQTKTKQQQQ